MKAARQAGKLAERQRRQLCELGWEAFVGRSEGLWVSLGDQRLRLVRGRSVLRSYACSTAQGGPGNVRGSHCTPLGWHEIAEKIGEGLPQGAILQARQWTGQVWNAGEQSVDDLILSRILRLTGLQDGINRGGEVDTWNRFIYIHGTSEEDRLGVPISHGCVRLANSDVIDLFDLVSAGCRVLITVEGTMTA